MILSAKKLHAIRAVRYDPRLHAPPRGRSQVLAGHATPTTAACTLAEIQRATRKLPRAVQALLRPRG